MDPRERILDIGCGDGYFLLRSKCIERYGLDKRTGDDVTDSLDFPDSYFDYVTMLAVIEHIADPAALIKDIHRVLKPKGRLIFTTPKRQAEVLIRLYVKSVEEEHETYYDLNRVKQLAGDVYDVLGHHTFIFGLNQCFCLEKRGPVEPSVAGDA
jgi:ubiquinone/menaquinone biosynthesis C-methylase UbiE